MYHEQPERTVLPRKYSGFGHGAGLGSPRCPAADVRGGHARRDRPVWLPWGALLSLLVVACGDSSLRIEIREGANTGTGEAPDAGEPEVFTPIETPDPDQAMPAPEAVTLTRVDPASGPAMGGTEARVVGSGFVEGCRVFIGDRAADPELTEVRNSNEILITVPAGEIGPADVMVELPTGEVVRRGGAFSYYGFSITPAQGSTAGGTLVDVVIAGDPVSDGVELLFGDAPCTEVELVSPRRLRCLTPPGTLGPTAVTLRDPAAPNDDQVASQAFEYVDPDSNVYGGLSGPPIAGTVNVTVLDATNQQALPGALVVLGADPETNISGTTDMRGRVSLASADLQGPVTLHAALDCYQRITLSSFDAQDVTLFLRSTVGLNCQVVGGGEGVQRGQSGAIISGELMFSGTQEFEVDAWDIVPQARDNEVRVTYVYATRPTVFTRGVDPSRGGAMPRVVEEAAQLGEGGGYLYSLFVRPAGMAVYALSGLERTDTGAFVPYVMGVTRNVVAAPGASVEGVDIHMDIPLDREQQVVLSKVPSAPPSGPTEFRVQAHIDLGAEGVIVREVGARPLDLLSSPSAESPFRFFAQPPLTGVLQDARYIVVAGWYSGGYSDYPYTEAIHVGVPQSSEPVVIDDLLGVPQAEHPRLGEPLPEDRTLRWTSEGSDPDFYVVQLFLVDGRPIWTHIIPGDARSAVLPDLSVFEGHWDIPHGFVAWSLRGLRVPGFNYNRFNYSHLQANNWTYDTVDDFVFQMQ